MPTAMAALSADPARPPRPPAAYHRARAALASEWIKLRSLRSMLLTPLLGAAASILVSASAVRHNAAGWAHLDAVQKARFEPLYINFNFVVARHSPVRRARRARRDERVRQRPDPHDPRGDAAAGPGPGRQGGPGRPGPFALAVVITFTAFLSGQAILSGAHAPHLSFGDHHVLLHLLGIVYYMTAAGLIGLFAGVLVRSAAAAITSMFGLLLVLPMLADKITPDAVTRHTVPYLPLNLGDEMLHQHTGLSPGAAVAGLAAWVLVLAAAAAFSLRVRDA